MIDTEPKTDLRYNYYKNFLIFFSDSLLKENFTREFKQIKNPEHIKYVKILKKEYSDDICSYERLYHSHIDVYKLDPKVEYYREKIIAYEKLCYDCIYYNSNLFRYIDYNVFHNKIYCGNTYFELCRITFQKDKTVIKFIRKTWNSYNNFINIYYYKQIINEYIGHYSNGNKRIIIYEDLKYSYHKNSYIKSINFKHFYKNKRIFFY